MTHPELQEWMSPYFWEELELIIRTCIQLVMAYIGTVSFSVLFSVPPKHYFHCGITGVVGWAVYLFISTEFKTPIVATFFASAVLTMYARRLAVRCKATTTVFLLCGIFTLVPGAGIYYTAANFFTGDGQAALLSGMDTIKMAVAIGLGIGVAYSVPARWFGWKKKAEVWQENN